MIRITITAVLLTLFSFSAHAMLISNGSFEAGPFLGPSGLIVVPKPSSPTLPPTAIDDWTVTQNNVDYIQTGAFGLTAQSGSKFIDLTGGDNGFGAIEQSVTLQVGELYRLEFYIGGSNLFVNSNPPRDNGDPGVIVSISGLADMLITGSRNLPNDWQQQSLTFVAAQAGTTLSFAGTQTDECCYIGLDHVSLRIPEPGIIALFGLGLAGLGLSRSRKGK